MRSAKNPPGRPRQSDSLLTYLSAQKRLRINPNHATGKNKWLVRCENKKCKEYLVYDPKNRNRLYICKTHKGAQLIAGRMTTSKYWIRWKSKITGWRKGLVNGKTTHLPLAKCQHPKCSKIIWFPFKNRKIDRNYLVCTVHCENPNRLRPFEAAYRKLHHLYALAKERNGELALPVTLTYEQFFSLARKSRCHYCFAKINRQVTNTRMKRGSTNSFLDRTDTTKGYEPGNVVPCCALCNRTKNAWLTKREMLLIGAMRSNNYDLATKHLQLHMSAHAAEKKKIEKVIARSKKTAGWGYGRPAKYKEEKG